MELYPHSILRGVLLTEGEYPLPKKNISYFEKNIEPIWLADYQSFFLSVVEGLFILGVLIPGPLIPGLLIPGVLIPGVLIPGVLVPGVLIPVLLIPGVFIPGTAWPNHKAAFITAI